MSVRNLLGGVLACMVLHAAPAAADFQYRWDTGLDFTGSTFGAQSGFIPPDTMGAVGPSHIVELINGAYRVYDKSDGSVLASTSLNSFWDNSGAGYSGSYAFDPRIVYDPFSERFFASSVDNARAANNFLLAVSNSSDPTDGWTGWRIDADSNDTHWADFDTLGFDADGVYIAANMFAITSGPSRTHVLAVPKADLVSDTPSVANGTVWEDIDPNNTGFSIQPVVDMDNTGTPARLLSAYNTPSGYFKRSSITGDIYSPTLDTGGGFITVDAYSGPPDADQPGTKQNIDTNDSRMSSNIVLVNGSLWGVQSVTYNGRSALRWFEIDEATNTLVQDGLIADSDMDFYYGSIAVNDFGVVAIGFTGSSETRYASSYIALGETDGGVTSFRDPMLLHAGVDDYQRLDSNNRNRWGDYSATVVDPLDPWSFWTFQEFVSADNTWSTRITLVYGESVPEPDTIALMGMGLAALVRLRRRRSVA